MDKCWANTIGGCCSKLSSEHYISGSLFGDSITVKGFGWCPQPKTIGNASLVAKILCKNHNQFLSELDGEAKKLWEALDKTFDHSAQLSKNAVINGTFIERWMLKTLCNIMITGKQKFEDDTTHPPKELVEIIFGIRPINKECGLAVFHSVGNNLKNEARVTSSDIYDDKGLVGIKVGFRNINFVTTFSKPIAQLRDPDYPGVKPMFHLARINHAGKKHHIDFTYN